MALRRSCLSPLHGVVLLLSAIVGACASPPPAIPLKVEYAGCKAVRVPGPVCVLNSKRELHLWVGAPPNARIALHSDEARIEAPGETVRDGRRFSLRIPHGARKLGVLVETGEGEASWSLSLAEQEKAKEVPIRQAGRGKSRDVLGEISRKTTLLYQPILDGDLATARRSLSQLRLPAKAPAECHYYLSYYQGLLGEYEGDYRSALAKLQEAANIAERLALNRLQWLAEEELAVVLRVVGRSRDSAQLFERLHRKSYAKDPGEEAQLLTNQAWSALLAREAGESVADPTRLLERALELRAASKSTRTGKKVNLLLNLALAHLWEGRLQQAKQVLAQAHKLEPDPSLSHMLWWLDLEARIALREGRPTEALHRFDDLEELARETSSADGRLRAAFGQARSHEALMNQAASLETLRRAEILLDEQSLQIPIHEGRDYFVATRQAIVNLHVELLLDQARNTQALEVARHARSRVLRQLEHGDRLASLTPDLRTRWARILTDYQRKRTTLEERAKNEWKVPTDQVSFEKDKRRGEAEDAKLLLDKAFRILGDSGERPGGALPPPLPGELILAYHPLPRGWVGFAADEETVIVRRFELPPDVLARPEELARRLLRPFRSSIKKAKRIRILPSGPLQGVDFHALPFEGDVLLARGPVVYGLDLPLSPEPVHASGRRALLVADPRNDLPGTLAEVRTVRKVLESGSRPWITEELKNVAASAEAVRGRLPAADLLHYAGHGAFSGFGGWESGLLLAEESQLIPGDLLALNRVPAWVVLSACDTGQSSAETPVESLGLAHAFLLAGARAVVASTRKAEDREIPAFFVDLYRQWDREPDLAVALQRAQLAWRQRSPEADWPSFRLFEP